MTIELKDDARIRAVRGWCLGSPLYQWERREHKQEGRDCGCQYSTPYMHSLTVQDYCWTHPIMRNPEVCMRGGKHLHRPLTDCEVGSYTAGGFYSYHPKDIERMSKWKFCRILGVVSPFGLVAEHEKGYRSDVIRIDCLWVLRMDNLRYGPEWVTNWLMRTYECPVTIVDRSRTDSFVEWLKNESVENLVRYGTQEKVEA